MSRRRFGAWRRWSRTGAHPSAVFDAVTREVAEVLDASAVSLARYDDDVITVIAQFGTAYVRIGERLPLGGTNVTSTVPRTGGTARLDDVAAATGPIGEVACRAGVRSTVGAPVVVDGRSGACSSRSGRTAGAARRHRGADGRLRRAAGYRDRQRGQPRSANRVARPRARRGDEARRRVVRDLQTAPSSVSCTRPSRSSSRSRRSTRAGSDAEPLLAEALGTAERATHEVRELAHGILPSVLPTAGCAPVSTHSCRDWISPSTSTS